MMSWRWKYVGRFKEYCIKELQPKLHLNGIQWFFVIHQHWRLVGWPSLLGWNRKTKAFAASGQGQWIGMDRWIAPLPTWFPTPCAEVIRRDICFCGKIIWQDLEKALMTAKKVQLRCCQQLPDVGFQSHFLGLWKAHMLTVVFVNIHAILRATQKSDSSQ